MPRTAVTQSSTPPPSAVCRVQSLSVHILGVVQVEVRPEVADSYRKCCEPDTDPVEFM